MKGDEAKKILGLHPSSSPTVAQVKAAYRNKVWESHPDLFPCHRTLDAESNFKLISEAYSFLLSGSRVEGPTPVTNVRVMKTGFPRGQGSNRSSALIHFPFLLLVLGTVALGGLNATRAYRKQKETFPSHNPFLP